MNTYTETETKLEKRALNKTSTSNELAALKINFQSYFFNYETTTYHITFSLTAQRLALYQT